MKRNLKLIMYMDNALCMMIFSLTSPVLIQHFMSSVGSNTIAISNCASMVLGTMISLSFQKVKIIKFYRKHFVPIVAIEVIGFAIVSFGGINYPAMRVIGIAVLNGSTILIWQNVSDNMIQHFMSGDDLTVFRSMNDAWRRGASICGYFICLFIDLDVETAIMFQVMESVTTSLMSVYVWYNLKKDMV